MVAGACNQLDLQLQELLKGCVRLDKNGSLLPAAT